MGIPNGPEGITPEWLSQVLGAEVTGCEVEQVGVGVGLLGRLYRVRLVGDGIPDSVIVKIPTLDEGARMNVVVPLRFYEKEVRFYEEAAEESPVYTPRLYHSSFDSETGDFVLVLEDLCDCRMEDQTVGCTIADARVAVDALVDLHAHWWADERLDRMPWMYRGSDPPFPQVLAGMFKQAWPRFLEGFGHQTPAHIREMGERFPDLMEWFMTQGSRDPVTLLHGDFRLDNLFFANGSGQPPLTAVDWQIALQGRSAYDLAYFVSQSLSTTDRRAHEDELVRRYHEGLTGRGIDYPYDEFWDDYRRTVLFCFMYPSTAAGQIEFTNERQRELVSGMLERSIAAIEDVRATELIP